MIFSSALLRWENGEEEHGWHGLKGFSRSFFELKNLCSSIQSMASVSMYLINCVIVSLSKNIFLPTFAHPMAIGFVFKEQILF